MRTILSLGLVAVSGSSAAAQALPAPPAPPLPIWYAVDAPPALSFYPTIAKEGGVDGVVEISCKHDSHMRLTDCRITSETPAGLGFGHAALEIAARSAGNPWARPTQQEMAVRESFSLRFNARPASISPVIVGWRPQGIYGWAWRSKPTDDQVLAAYPQAALRQSVAGFAQLTCWIDPSGAFTNCESSNERPKGQGFGAAAQALAPYYALQPTLTDGRSVGGGRVAIGVDFRLPGSPPLMAPPAPHPQADFGGQK